MKYVIISRGYFRTEVEADSELEAMESVQFDWDNWQKTDEYVDIKQTMAVRGAQ